MTPKEKQLHAVISQVRRCFNELKALAEHLHETFGVNPSMRAVIESLAMTQPQTVPDIARSKGVSRQHIQKIMNELVDDGFVRALDNPAHKRSLHFELTRKGKTTFAKVRNREAEPLRHLAAAMSLDELCQAENALAHLNQQLAIERSVEEFER